MTKRYKQAFTITEVLLTIVVVGVISILTLPSVLSDMHNKSRMSLLKATVIGVNDVVHQEITAHHTDDITLTDLYGNPTRFLNKFDTSNEGEPFAAAYKSYEDDVVQLAQPESSILLKNGVGIGVINRFLNKESSGIVVDVTGSKPPNIIGVDYFAFEIAWEDDEENGVHIGDVHAYYNGGAEGDESAAGLREQCLNGNPAACYRMAELSGFNHDYLAD